METEFVLDGKVPQIVLKIAQEVGEGVVPPVFVVMDTATHLARTLQIAQRTAEVNLLVFAETDIVIQAARILTIVPKIVVEGVHASAEMGIAIHLVRIPITALKIAEAHLHLVKMNVPIQDKDAALEHILIRSVETMIQIPA